MAASAVLPAEAIDLKDEGNQYFAAKSYDQALDRYSRALALAPNSAVLLSNLSATHLALKQWGKALERANECLAADPSFIKAYGRKAAAQMGLIRPGDAEKTLLAGLKHDPGNSFLKDELEKLREEDDGDQSPKRSRDGSDRGLRDMQARTGVNMTPMSPWPNDTFVAAYMGNERAFLENFKQGDLKLRALEARLPLLIVVVSGAQRIRGPGADPSGKTGSDEERGSQHSKVLRRLIEAGARVDGKDRAGWTALHHATAHHPVLDLARILLDAGADVNLQDRFGTYPLVSAVMSAEVKSVKLLLQHGARPDLKDNDGCDTIGVSRFHSEIQALIHQAQYSNIRPGAKEKVCAMCGAAGATKACSRCANSADGVYYCSRECQAAHWKTHKAQCNKAAASGSGASAGLPRTLRVPIEADRQTNATLNTQAFLTAAMANMVGVAPEEAKRVDFNKAVTDYSPQETKNVLARAARRATAEQAMKVKIQVPAPISAAERAHLVRLGENLETMLCYNQDRSLQCQLDGSSPAGRQLAQLIRSQGVLGLKGYFSIYFDAACLGKNGVPTEMVVETNMLPAQPF